MTVNLRRLAGLTSLAENLRRSQRVSTGPSGAAVSAIGSPSSQYSLDMCLSHQSGQDRERHRQVTDDQDDRQDQGARAGDPLTPGGLLAERAYRAEEPVAQ